MLFFSIPKVFAQTPEELIGEIEVPQGVYEINQDAGGIGIILFISNMIKFLIILGGLWSLMNFILAAFLYLTGGGKADNHAKVSSRFTMSVIGLLLMILSYTAAALIGYLFYGNASYILEPVITPIGV